MTTSSLPLNTDLVRSLFPAFDQQEIAQSAFFENAGGSYISAPVVALLQNYQRKTKVQPYGAFATSVVAGQAMDNSYQRIAKALDLDDSWIHFGPSTSANSYVLAHAFSQIIKAGEAIIVTNQDHEANSGVWRKLVKNGVEVREWHIDKETGELDPKKLANLLDDKVRFVAFPHVSNIVGQINPAKQICQIIHDANALAIVDGVSYCPHGLPDLGDMNPDIYLFSAYKTFGPHVGVMAVRPDLAASLPNQGHHFNDHKPRYRLTPAGPDHAQIAAMAAIANYLEQISVMAKGSDSQNITTPFQRAHDAIRAQETALMTPFLDWIKTRNDLRLIGPDNANNRVPTFSFALDVSGFEMAKKLEKHGILAGGGHFYAQRVLQGLGLDAEHGVLRISFVHYTSENDISRLLGALDAEL